MEKSQLSPFFEPASVAILGSLREGFFGGYVVVKSLLRGGYKGKIYPINPGYKEILGIPVYPSLKEVPEAPDLALIMINSRSVPDVIRQCVKKGVKAAIVVADGFAERDEEGARLQQQLVAIAREAGIRLMGPNTAGVVNTHNNFYPCPYEAGYDRIQKGSIALISQTGVTNPQAFPYPDYVCGVSKICDLGNKCDVDECDLLEYLNNDAVTNVVSMYLETVRHGQRFFKIAHHVAIRKPLLVFKSGRSAEGARASQSHTGSLAVDDTIFNAACNQTGILRLDRFTDIFEIPKIFATQPLPAGNRLGILTITGGVAVIAIDYAQRYGLQLSQLDPATMSMLDNIFPGSGNMPVDIGPMMAAVKDAFSHYPEILEGIMADPNVDALLHIIWANTSGYVIENYIKAYERIMERFPKPVATWIYGPDSSAVRETGFRLERMGFPVFKEVETAVKALGLALRYATYRRPL